MSDEREQRIQKLERLRALGVDPFGKRFDGARPVAELLASYNPAAEGMTVTVTGRITALRSHGKASFLDLRDRTGKIQVYIKKDKVGDTLFNVFEQVDIGDFVAATGGLVKTRTGEITVFADTFTLLAKALRPLPEKWHGLKDPEIRYRRRYLDMISNPEVLDTFLKRARILTLIRQFLDARGYVEVETPMMQSIPGGAAARPFVTHHHALGMDFYLRIATEIYLKKLIVGGIEKVYEIGKNFRNEGIDTRHNPEFTAMELYHAYGDLRTMMELTENLVAQLAKEVCGGTRIPFGERSIDVTPPWPREDYLGLIRKYAGVDAGDHDGLQRILKGRGIDPSGMGRIELLDKVFGETVEPNLENATFVMAQPIEMTPLCREIPDRLGSADRFEVVIAGMEVANAYTELNDPLEQRRRLVEQAGGGSADEMVREGKIDEDFLLALEHGMPPAGGLGIGIDRLVMILTDRTSIREVILFPLLREAPPLVEPTTLP